MLTLIVVPTTLKVTKNTERKSYLASWLVPLAYCSDDQLRHLLASALSDTATTHTYWHWPWPRVRGQGQKFHIPSWEKKFCTGPPPLNCPWLPQNIGFKVRWDQTIKAKAEANPRLILWKQGQNYRLRLNENKLWLLGQTKQQTMLSLLFHIHQKSAF